MNKNSLAARKIAKLERTKVYPSAASKKASKARIQSMLSKVSYLRKVELKKLGIGRYTHLN